MKKKSIFISYLFIFFLTIFSKSISQDPRVLWYYDLNSASFGNACAADIDGDGYLEIVFSTYFNDEAIYALNGEDGSLLWKYITNGCNDAAPLILDVDNDGLLEVILHSSSNHNLFCFNGTDGSIKWMVPTYGTDSPPSSEDIDKDGYPEIFGGDFYGQLNCFNGMDGSTIWKTKVDTNCTVQTEPVIEDVDKDGELDCIVATWKRNLPIRVSAYRLRDGLLIWSSTAPNEMIYHGPTIADIDNDGIMEVIIGSYDDVLYCLNGTNGEVKWTFSFIEKRYIGAPTTIADINNDGKYEIALVSGDRITILNHLGKLLWYYDLKNWYTAFRGVVFSDMNNDEYLDVVFGSSNGLLVALSGFDGKVIFEYDLSEVYGRTFDINHGPIIADFDKDGETDIFVVGGYYEYPAIENNYGRAYLIAVGKTNGPDWLMFRNNNRRNAVLPLNPSNIPSINNKEEIQVFYNNVEDAIIIKFGNTKDIFTDFSIYNVSGLKLLQGKLSTETNNSVTKINVDQFANGVYFIQFNSNNQFVNKTFMKVNK